MSTTVPTRKLPRRRLGDSELAVSLVGLGCNNFGRRLDLGGTAAVLEAALDAGINFFDTADIYGAAGASEALMGKALEGRRDEYLVATKFGMEIEGAEGKRRSSSPASPATPISSPCRTSTACSSAGSRRRWRRSASGSGSRSCPTSRSPAAC